MFAFIKPYWLASQTTAYLLLGSNLGDRHANLRAAISMIGKITGPIVRTSSIYQTAAWGIAEQPDFFNIAVQINTALEPDWLLKELLNIETTMGRVREVKWGSRLIDIDILFFGDLIIDKPELKIPHPGIPSRRFVLEPLNELNPELYHPEMGSTIKELLQSCPDTLDVKRLHLSIY